jgi:hypothetical protein
MQHVIVKRETPHAWQAVKACLACLQARLLGEGANVNTHQTRDITIMIMIID